MIYARLDEAIEDLDSRLGGLARPTEAEDIWVITLGGAAGAGGGPAPSSHQGPFQHVVAGEGFEPSKLSRWIYNQRRQACDQQYCPSSRNFRAYSPQIADDHRLQPDTSSQSAFTVWWHHDVQAGRSSPRRWDRRMPHVVHSAARSTSVD
jgi:hypothetical protein